MEENKKTSGEFPHTDIRGIFVPAIIGVVVIAIVVLSAPFAIEQWRIRSYSTRERSLYSEWKSEYLEIQPEVLYGDGPSDDFVYQYHVLNQYYQLVFSPPYGAYARFYMSDFNRDEIREMETLRRHPFDPLIDAYKDVVYHPNYSLENFQLARVMSEKSEFYIDRITMLMVNNILYDFIHDDSDTAFENLDVLIDTWQPADYAGGGSYKTSELVNTVCNVVEYLEKYHPDVFETNREELLSLLIRIHDSYLVETGYNMRATYMIGSIRHDLILGRRTEPVPENFEQLSSVQITAVMLGEPIDNIYPWQKPNIFQRVRWMYLEEKKWMEYYMEPFHRMEEKIEEMRS